MLSLPRPDLKHWLGTETLLQAAAGRGHPRSACLSLSVGWIATRGNTESMTCDTHLKFEWLLPIALLQKLYLLTYPPTGLKSDCCLFTFPCFVKLCNLSVVTHSRTCFENVCRNVSGERALLLRGQQGAPAPLLSGNFGFQHLPPTKPLQPI